MQNLYQYMERVKNNDQKIKDNFYLLKKNEFEMFKNDQNTFKHFYGESNFLKLASKLKNDNDIKDFISKVENRNGKNKYLIKVIQEKINKINNKDKILYLENKIRLLKNKNNKLKKTKKIKPQIFEESSFEEKLSKFENLIPNTLGKLFKKGDPSDGKLLKYSKIIAKTLVYGLLTAFVALKAPILLVVPFTVMIVYMLYKILTIGSVNAIKVFQAVLKFKGITKFLPEKTAKQMSEYADGSAEKFKKDMQKSIDKMRENGQKQFADVFNKSVAKISTTNPKVILTIKLAFLFFKTFAIFASPVTFATQMFSGMLLRSCGTVADTLLDVLKNVKNEEGFFTAIKKAIGIEGDAVEKIKKSLDKDKVEIKENFSSDLINNIDQYYYEHIKKNVINKSLFLKENKIYNENAIDQNKNEFLKKYHKDRKMEVINGYLEKGNIKYFISPMKAEMKIKVGKNLITHKEIIDKKIKEIGFTDSDNLVINSDGSIKIENKTLDKLELLINKKQITQKTDSEEKQQETKETEKQEAKENEKEKFLKQNSVFYLKIKEGEAIDISNLDLLKSKPNDGDGYVKLTKKDDTNVFSAEIFLKNIVNHKKNALLKTIFENEEIKNKYINVTQDPALLEIKIENNNFELAKKGGFLGFNKKIDKIGKLNDNYKEYANKIVSQIEKDISKQNKKLSKKESDILTNKLSDVSNINFKQDIEEIKNKKLEEIRKYFGEDAIEHSENEANEKKLPFISSRNAIALGLFTLISSLAVAWHAGVSTNPLGLTISAFANAGASVIKEKLLSIFDVPISEFTKLNDLAKDGLKDFGKSVTESFNVNADDLANNKPGNIEQAVKNNYENSGAQFIVKGLADAKFSEESFENIKKAWIEQHQEAKIELKDITANGPHKDLYDKLESFNQEVIGSLNNPKDPFYHSKNLINDLNKVSTDEEKLKVIKKYLDFSTNSKNGWINGKLSEINSDGTKIDDIITDKKTSTEETSTDKKPAEVKAEETSTDKKPVEVKAEETPTDKKSVEVKAEETPAVEENVLDIKTIINNTNELPTEVKNKLIFHNDEIKLINNKIADINNETLKGGLPVVEQLKIQETQKGFVIDKIKKLLIDNQIVADSVNISNDDLIKIASKTKLGVMDNTNNFIKNMGDSYEYEKDDNEFLFNEYFRLENKLNKWKK